MEQLLWFIAGILVCYFAMTGWGKVQGGRKILAGPPKPSPEEQKKKAEKEKADRTKARRMRTDGLVYLLICLLLLGFILFMFMRAVA